MALADHYITGSLPFRRDKNLELLGRQGPKAI